MRKTQFGVFQLRQRGLQRRLVAPDHGVEQRIGEFAPDRGADLRDFLDRRQPVEPRHQRILQRRGDRQRRQRAVEAIALAVLDQQPGFQHGLGQFLDEQRHAVGLGDDLRHHFGRQLAAAGHALDQGLGLAAVEPAERHRGDVGQALPGRLEFRPEGDQQQHRQTPDPLDREIEQFERGRIGPMCVLEQHQHRLLLRQTFHLIEQRRKGLAALLRRRKVSAG